MKIGEREHLKDLIRGKLYCSPSERYIKQELEQNDKGQGDLLEGKLKIHFESVRISNDEMACKLPKGTVAVGIDGVQYMPIFCMTAGMENYFRNLLIRT